MIRTALICLAEQWYSHLPLEISLKRIHKLCAQNFKKKHSINLNLKIKLIFFSDSITRESVKQFNAVRTQQLAWKSFVKFSPDIRKAQMIDSLTKAADSELARRALKKLANHKSLALEHNFSWHNWYKKSIRKSLTEHLLIDTRLKTNYYSWKNYCK